MGSRRGGPTAWCNADRPYPSRGAAGTYRHNTACVASIGHRTMSAEALSESQTVQPYLWDWDLAPRCCCRVLSKRTAL